MSLMSDPTNPSDSPGAKKRSNGIGPTHTLLSDNLVLTQRGSRVYDLIWDFRDDRSRIGIFDWNADIISNSIKIGTLGDRLFDDLRRPFQEAIAVRWKYRRREDGRAWQAKRAAGSALAARAFACWAAALGITSVAQIDGDVFQAWLDHTELHKNGNKLRQHRDRIVLADAVLLLWRVRDRISTTLGFTPHSIDAADWVKPGPDSTPIRLIPKPVLDHLVGAALQFVEVYSHDILQARARVTDLTRTWETKFGKSAPAWERTSREYSAFNVWIGRRLGMIKRRERKKKQEGSPAPWNPDGQFVPDPGTGNPWLREITTRHHLQQLENSLRTSCYIIIAFMTGGRNSDLARLKTKCANTIEHDKASALRHEILGEVTKHRGRAPEEVVWTVPKVAIQAAGILLGMSAPWRERSGSECLFVTQTGGKLTDSLTNNDLKVFLKRIDAPYVDGKPFPISSHMLRVALAQWLAQEPYGEIAGAIHLKQLSTAAFRGYLREDPQFQSMFEAFEVQAHMDHLEMAMQEPVVHGRQGAQILQSRTPEQQAELEAQVRSINFAQAGREAPPPRTMRKLKKSQRPVYKTKYTMCFFKADAAECLKGKPLAERSRPITHRCEPLTCANSAITRLQVPAYLEDLEEYAKLSEDTSQSPSQLKLYREQMADLARLILPYRPILVRERTLLDVQLTDAHPREATTAALRDRRKEIERLLQRIEAADLPKVVSA